MSNHYLRIFTQPKSAILLILGFASGLPLALTSGTLQAWMTVENIDLKTIGFFSLVGQAYVFKFLWSPVMDRYTPPFLGRRRGWLLATQILLLIAIAAMGFLEPSTQLRWMAALAVVIAFCSASQDIVFDAWKTDVLAAEERGTGAAISVLGYRLGMLVSGGLALWLADRWLGWQGMYWLMAGTAAFVALLMTLCNKSFSATQFALLSALSAVGRVYVGPIAGWFVEAHGWPAFYLFSVVAAVPGILLLLICRRTLEHTQRSESFMPRTLFPQAYGLALVILAIGCLILAIWLLLLVLNALDYTTFSFLAGLLEVAVLTAVAGILLGAFLDYLALRKTELI